jgi:hypothetical protein
MLPFSVEVFVKADTWTSWMVFYLTIPCPAQSWGYNEVLAAVRFVWVESQICLTEAQLSALPGTIQDRIYEQCLVRALLP